VSEENSVRAVEVFVFSVDLDKLGFIGVQPPDVGRPSYSPSIMHTGRVRMLVAET
jgi:hypothetical protein